MAKSALVARAIFASLVLQDDPRALPVLQKIAKRKDVSSKEGEKKYGDVTYADETNKKYPLDTKKHVKAAWSYINMPKNAGKYSSSDLTAMKKRIKAAAKKIGIEITEEQGILGDDVPVTQSHYHVDGSLEDFSSKVSSAFRLWKRTRDDSSRWSYILGIFTDCILYYTSDWESDTYKYYMVDFSVNGDTVTIDPESIEECGVKMVITALGVDDDDSDPADDGAAEQAATGGTSMDKEQEKSKVLQAGDDVTNTDKTVASDALKSGEAEHSDDNPNVVEPKTAAETAGASVPDASGEATSSGEIEHSGDEGVSKAAGDNSTDGAVKTEMGKEAAGTKQQAIQSLSVDSHNESIAYVTVQSIEDKPDGSKLMKLQGIATRGDIVNGAGEVYPTKVWQDNMARMNKEAAAGKFIGKLEHPGKEQGLVDTAIKFDKFWLQGADVWFDATVVPTEPYGKNLQALIEAGVQVDMSSRGYGTFQLQNWRGIERSVMQDGFICTAFDAVWKGASTGSGVKSVSYQSEQIPSEETQETMDKETKVQSAQERADSIRAADDLKRTKAALLGESKLSDLGQKAYQSALDKATSLDDLFQVSDSILPHLQGTFPVEDATEVKQSETYSPRFYTKASQDEIAPKNVGEMFQRLVQDLPDTYEGIEATQNKKVPNHFTSPKKACYQLMCNIAKERNGSFSGRNAALGMLALEQGQTDRAEDILLQSLPTGATVAAAGADGDGAPLSNYLIFPLVRRVFPMYIMNLIAAIQPMDRPEGKIFYLDQYRVDSEGSETRMDLNTSANPFNSSFADNATEGAASRLIRLRLASATVSAHTKKLGAAWSIEEMQDLRAYHGLDAAQELMGGVAREMALEWNKEVLDDMVAQATAAALTFGTVAPATGFDSQKDWDEYIWVYLQKLDNAIFGQRNGPMTDIVAGMDAALALSKSMRGTFTIGGDGGDMGEAYPGTTFYGKILAPNGSRYRVFKTNFWASGTTNGSKIMGFRKGTEWSDTPYVWAPYTDYVTPLLTDPADFSQKQGLVSRAAKKVVVANAIGTLTVDSGGQGVVL